MNENYDQAFKFVMKWEGYKSDDPDDPGGRTIFGISARSWPETVEVLWDQPKKIVYAKAKDFYYHEYWLKANCDKIPWPMDIFKFDTAVNLGVHRSNIFEMLAKSPDDFLLLRITRYVQRAKDKFLRGLLNRVVDLYHEWRQ